MLLSAIMLKDINTSTADGGGAPAAAVGSSVFLAATDATGAVGLYTTDGTAQGTSRVMPLPRFDRIGGLVAAVPLAYYVFGGNAAPDELWRSDSTDNGTFLLAKLDWQTSPFGSDHSLVASDSTAFFYARAPESTGPMGLWISDGTQTGTKQLTAIGGEAGTAEGPMAIAGQNTFFVADHGSAHLSLWRSDGTGAGTFVVADFPSDSLQSRSIGQLTPVGNALYFTVKDTQGHYTLWKTDGSAIGTSQIASYSYIGSMTGSAGRLFFTYQDSSDSNNHLGATDGTPQGINTVTLASSADPLSPFGQGVVFQDFPGNLWRSDATPAGTVQITTAPLPLSAGNFTQVGNRLYFSTYSVGTGPSQVWESDGTPTGTVPLANVAVAGPISGGTFMPLDDGVYFAATDGLHGEEPWITDGTQAGTHLITDINTADAGSWPAHFTTSGSQVYFSATQDGHGDELWKTDGTAGGTALVKDMNPYGLPPANLTDVNGTLFFTASDGAHSNELWTSDGTNAGTTPVADLGNQLPELAAFDAELYFAAVDIHGQWHLGRSDGTAGGTMMLLSIPQQPRQLVSLGQTLLVDSGHALWAVSANSMSLTAIGPGTIPGGGNGIVSNGTYYYLAQASGGFGAVSLYRSDGTPQGTFQVNPLTGQHLPYGQSAHMIDDAGELYFALSDINAQDYLWKTDGTAGGTVVVTDRIRVEPEVGLSLGVLNGDVFFAGWDEHGLELWKTDGTAAGTLLVKDLFPGSQSGSPNGFRTAGGTLFFIAEGSNVSLVLWATDGTDAGTRIVADPAIVDLQGSQPLLPFHDKLYFAADDGVHGVEPWALDLTGSIAGTVYGDANHNQTLDPNERGIAGVTVFLDTNNNGVLDAGEVSTVTSADGSYDFTNLVPGLYVVRQVPPAGWRQTAPLPGTTSFQVAAAASVSGPLFGDVQVSTVPLDFNYLVALAAHYDQPGTFAMGDLNDDGRVDFNDLVILAANYGRSLATTTAAARTPPSLKLQRRRR